MLQKLREKTTGWVAVVIIGLLIIPFAFVGLQSYVSGAGDTSVARVEAPPEWWPSAPHAWPLSLLWEQREVSQQDFQRRYQTYRQQMQQQMGERFDPRQFDSDDTRLQLLERVVDEQLLRLEVERRRLLVPDALVREQIANEVVFQIDGRFDSNQYRMALMGAGMTPLGFERSVREDLQVQLLPSEISRTTLVDAGQAEDFLRISGQQRDLQWVEVAAGEEVPAPSAEDVASFYDAHADRYMQPARVALEYVEIDGSTLPEPAVPGEDELRQRYEEESGRFVEADQRLVSHILVAVPADADAAAEDAARGEAAALAEQARAEGADFAALAREASDDLGSKAAGGDLGWLERGIAEASFDDALFALEPGQVSDPVRTAEGWHVIQLREVREGDRESFDEVRDSLASEAVTQARQQAFSELSGRLMDQVYQDPGSLAPAAAEAGVKLQTTPLFARGEGEGIAANADVQQAAFSEAGLQGQVSDPIELGPQHIVLVRVRDQKPATPRPLEQIREQVQDDLLAERRAEAAQARAEALLARAQEGADLPALAEAEGLALQEADDVGRSAASPAPELVRAAFDLPKPEEGAASYGLARVGDRYAVVGVTEVGAGDLSAIQGPMRDMLRNQLAGAYGAVEVRAYLEALRRQYRVSTHPDRLR
ncbi:SurA N-terminal domain-containing protein [Coralloluteibacterium stylophorae]|uniref:Periplasmic chaperone PpiD n=1 Tax=Coralloluteibacterium stylophorae TaxID=1776034 RepID=A0A8J7VTP7_9GAMM|nr:peptidyl-prolyl cis-trans isomerase [Coralloluteibacterium stylophorae]MBS7457662.1 peptidyl-prolyl cis-trans isomerase [Coralloluteibacterium stylophorae]